MIPQSIALSDFFTARQLRGESLVLATIIETMGSTYRKAGAQMLIASDGQAAGLLSGGCAESDLIERAQRVCTSGKAEIVVYDTRGSDDVIWGIGLGCEGAMRILLSRIGPDNNYEPFTFITECIQAHRLAVIALVITENNPYWPLGYAWCNEAFNPSHHPNRNHTPSIPQQLQIHFEKVMASAETAIVEFDNIQVFIAPIKLPTRVLILGAGADTVPIVEFAASLGWQVSVADHRSAYAKTERFARAREVICSAAADLSSRICFNDFDAAIVMSHHLTSDQIYLAALADSNIKYIGLLGPANRRARLLSEIGNKAEGLTTRLAGPVGLDIGAQTPEAIALAIVAEIYAHQNGRRGGSFSGVL